MNKYYKLNDHKLLAFETRGNLDDNFVLFVHQYYVDNEIGRASCRERV